jgi:endo-1,3(4)-beta-glucanase
MAPRPQNSYGSISDGINGKITAPIELRHGDSIPEKEGCCAPRGCGFSWLKKPTVVGGVIGAIIVVLSMSHSRLVDPVETKTLWMSSPEADMGLMGVDRQEDATPSPIWGKKLGPLPTNSWYLNLVSHRAIHPDESTRAYTTPYIIDTNAALNMPGIRVHWPVMSASERNVQMVNDFKNGISLGTLDKAVKRSYKVDDSEDLSLFGVTLKWGQTTKSMVTHIVRGMPYGTIRYSGGVLPSLYSYNAPASPPLIDGKTELECGVMDGKAGASAMANKEVRLHFLNSDFTWVVFFSKPVEIRCAVSEGDPAVAEFQLNVTSYADSEEEPLTVRLALIDQCTTGMSNIKQHCLEKAEWNDQEGYVELLRRSAGVFPSSPKIDFEYPHADSDAQEAHMTIDWDARRSNVASKTTDELIMFALPHHQETMKSDSDAITDFCIPTFHGSTCLVKGEKWVLSEDVSTPQSFTARRPPEAEAIPALADAISQDIHYSLSNNMLRGAADTYFSGKILSKFARVILVTSELKKLSAGMKEVQMLYDDIDEESLSMSIEAATLVDLPPDEDITAAVEQLKKGVQIWLNGESEAPYVYDRSWGGLVNCGCNYVGKGDKGTCNNTFPDCPALEDVNKDFGNGKFSRCCVCFPLRCMLTPTHVFAISPGYYNDHHFHYGYHIYAAAVVAKYDPSWGKEYFDKVLLYIRDIANPFTEDEYFTQFRQKDWFLGSSWASGIVSAENSPHGRNEESSSEAIAAYEAVALFGSVMVDAFGGDKSRNDNVKAAKLVRNVGQLLTVTEVKAANRYWHVWQSDTHNRTYPLAYEQPVVGMLYETMASFQTWFSPEAVVSYGIQLLPMTPVAESRDDPEWAADLYPMYDKSCKSAGDFCVDNGWSIIQCGLLATAGNRKEALEQALLIPSKVYTTDGGVGNSLTNTIWYISTRKPVDGNGNALGYSSA